MILPVDSRFSNLRCASTASANGNTLSMCSRSQPSRIPLSTSFARRSNSSRVRMKWPSIPPEIETARQINESGWMGSGSPLAKPWITTWPRTAAASRLPVKVLLPTPSRIRSAPSPSVSRFVSATKSLPGIQDHLGGARCARRPGLLFGRDGTDDARSKMLGPLHEQQTQPTCRCVNQYRVPGFGQVVFMDEIMGGHPLMRKRCALLKRKIAGQRDQLAGRDHTRFRIGPKMASVGDTIPWREFFDAFSDSIDDARAIKTRRKRKRWMGPRHGLGKHRQSWALPHGPRHGLS